MASILMPCSEVESGYGINFDATKENFPRSLYFSPSHDLPLERDFNFFSEAPIKMALLIPYLVRSFEKFLPEGLIFPLSRDLPLEGEIFPATPVKTVLPIPKLVRGLKNTSARLNFSPFS